MSNTILSNKQLKNSSMKVTIDYNEHQSFISNKKIAEIVKRYLSDKVTSAMDISVYSIAFTPNGYGHYEVVLNVEINGNSMELDYTTTNVHFVDAVRNDYVSKKDKKEAIFNLIDDAFKNNVKYILELFQVN